MGILTLTLIMGITGRIDIMAIIDPTIGTADIATITAIIRTGIIGTKVT
jgi:hypothetical protein